MMMMMMGQVVGKMVGEVITPSLHSVVKQTVVLYGDGQDSHYYSTFYRVLGSRQ